MIPIVIAMIRYLTSLLLSVTANKLQLALYRETNSREVVAEVGIRQMHAPRADFSKEEDLNIISLQAELGNQWTVIAERVNEAFGTDWSNVRVRDRFLQMEVESKQGGRKYRKVIFTKPEDDQILALRADYIKENNGSTYGLWKEIETKMPGKTMKDILNRWYNFLSKSSAVTSLVETSSDVASLVETSLAANSLASLDNQPNLFGVKTDGTSTALTMVAETTKTKSLKVAVKTAIREPSDYERQRQDRIARNNARLAELGFDSKPKEAKKKVVKKKRKSHPVDAPQRVRPERKRMTTTYNENEHLANIGLDKNVKM